MEDLLANLSKEALNLRCNAVHKAAMDAQSKLTSFHMNIFKLIYKNLLVFSFVGMSARNYSRSIPCSSIEMFPRIQAGF